MPRFFTPSVDGDNVCITGGDAQHITRVLRMRPGEKLTVCDGLGGDYLCEITGVSDAMVTLCVLERTASRAEPTVRATLYQGLPKFDKMDFIVQKSVELGISRVVPVLTARCVSRPDEKSMLARTERWNKIAFEAAKQCGRGIIPQVSPAMRFEDAVGELQPIEHAMLFYEGSGMGSAGGFSPDMHEIGFMVGPEGGFEPSEVQTAGAAGIRIMGLGPRILRTETAPLCVLSAVMYATGNL